MTQETPLILSESFLTPRTKILSDVYHFPEYHGNTIILFFQIFNHNYCCRHRSVLRFSNTYKSSGRIVFLLNLVHDDISTLITADYFFLHTTLLNLQVHHIQKSIFVITSKTFFAFLHLVHHR
jgi:hypothetical protein